MPIVMKSGTGESRGFTLVEMSIVLVIIGLIIGGILKGQEIVASARQKAVINQVAAIRSAANTYLDRYRALPGDDPSGATVDATNLVNGNGNGIVGTAATTRATMATNDGSTSDSEELMYFNALLTTNLIGGGTVAAAGSAAPGSFGTGPLPTAAIGGAGYTVMAGNPMKGRGTGTDKFGSVWIRIHKVTGTPAGALTPRTLLAIDTQIDDGKSGGGAVRGDDATGAAATCDNAGVYASIATDSPNCIGFFEQ